MQRIFRIIIGNQLLKSNFVMVVGNTVANIGAYAYHIAMGRLLTTSDYGALQSLISLMNILLVPTSTLNTVVVKLTASYVGQKETGKASYLYHYLKKFFIMVFLVGGISFLFFKKFILGFLHLNDPINFFILDFALFAGFLEFLNKATIQGFSKFVPLVITQFIESYGKLALGIGAVLVGLRTPGAFSAFILAGVISYIYTEWILARTIHTKDKSVSIPIKPVLRLSIPSFFMTVGIMSLFNIDVVLVRHFFPAHDSGLYAALSVLGKIIYFGTAPISSVMLPVVSGAHASGGGYQKTFFLSLVFTGICVMVATFIFTIAPRFFLKGIGSQYTDSATLLSYFSIFISLCSLISLCELYYYAIHKMLPIWLLVVAAICQGMLIWLYHGSLLQVISISLSVTASLFGTLLIYYLYVTRAQIAFHYRSRISSGKNN